MTDTFILQLPEFDDKIYYIPRQLDYDPYNTNTNTQYNSSFSQDDLNFPFSPSYIQEIEYDYTFPNKTITVDKTAAAHSAIEIQPHVIVPLPKHQADSYCPILNDDNISYEQYLKSNAFNSIIEVSHNVNVDVDVSSSSSSFSTYSSLFSNNNNNNKPVQRQDNDNDNDNETMDIDNIESVESPDSDIDDIILLPNAKNNNNDIYFPLDFQFITIIENKLTRYSSNNQDMIDKIRLQEISYRFSKTYV
ncbi:hypothetical protein MOSE0_E03048 [Monosporozyma servazzii]